MNSSRWNPIFSAKAKKRMALRTGINRVSGSRWSKSISSILASQRDR